MDVTYLSITHLPTKELIRIFSKIRISETSSYQNSPCWEWTSTLNKGYGYLAWDRRPTAAYRVLYAWLVEPLPSKASRKELDHLCKNKACVNPAHLELVPGRINNLRSDGPGGKNARKTHCNQGHPLEGDNLDPRYLPKRYCRICRKEWDKKRRLRPNQTTYNKEYRAKNAKRLREIDYQRSQDPNRQEYMRKYLKEYNQTYRRKPLTAEQKARRNERLRERRRKYGRSDRPKKPLP